MKKKKPTTHGGRREGAGRPAADEAEGLRRVFPVLSDRHIKAAKEMGDGNLSAGIRRALTSFKPKSPVGDDAKNVHRVIAMLNDQQIEAAKKFGAGNMSRGIRLALE